MHLLRALPVALGLLLLFAPVERATADWWPGPGLYDGVYHKDRWGRARVSEFIVPPELEARFAPFEGKRIRFEVKKGLQSSSPGPVDLQEVGDIQELETGPRLLLGVAKPAGGAEDEWLVTVSNTGDTAATIATNYLSLEYVRPETYDGSGSRAPRLHALHAEFAWSARLADCRPELVGIPAKASCALLFHVALDRRDGELGARYHHIGGASAEHCPYMAWRRADDPPATIAPSRFLLVRPEIAPWRERLPYGGTPEDGAYLLTGKLQPGSGGARLPIFSYQGVRGACFRMRAFDAQGAEIQVRSLVMCDDALSTRGRFPWDAGPYLVTDPPAQGFPVRVFFWPRSRFADEPIARVVLEVLAATGSSMLPVPVRFQDSLHLPPPPFGARHQGVRVRVRASPGYEGSTEFYVEAVNDAGEPVKLIAPTSPATEVELRLDGKEVPVYLRQPLVYGWAAEHACGERKELCLRPSPRQVLKPGTHTVEVIFRGHGGTHLNTHGRSIPVLDGELRTPETTVVIR